jgi:hypothetical protein
MAEMNTAVLDEIERVVATGADADDVLRAAVDALVHLAGCSWAGILFVEDRTLVLGPEAGQPDPGLRLQLPIVYEGARVAELVVDGCDDRELLDRVADLIAVHCLVGWDTGGMPWEP